jgi:hypothetical protein
MIREHSDVVPGYLIEGSPTTVYDQLDLNDLLDRLESVLIVHHATAKRSQMARERLEDAMATLYQEKRIEGATALQRDACLLALTHAERFELREAEQTQGDAYLAVQRAELVLKRFGG